MKSPAFQMYVNDFLGSAKVGMMGAEEIGIYLLLLFLDFQEKGFVYDSRLLAKWCRVPRRRFEKAWVIVGQCFVEREGRMFNPRLELERVKQAEWREKSSKGGLASAETRGKGGSGLVEPSGQPKGNTPSPTPSPITPLPPEGDEREKPADGYPPDFTLLWNAYPKKAGENNKRKAYKAYEARLRDGVAFDVMYEGVKRYRQHLIDTGKEGTDYVKMTATFLGPNRHFLDEYAAPNPITNGDAAARKVWGGMKRTKILFSVNRDEWNEKAADMLSAGDIPSVDWLGQLLRAVNRPQLQTAHNDHFAIEHIASVMPPHLKIA
jgi:uncharacterized protein YdaU (DUF1376 family)